MTVGHLVQNAAETPDVAWRTQFHEAGRTNAGHGFTRGGIDVYDRFRGHVVQGADLGFAVDIDSVILDCIGDPEVDEFKSALHEEEVCRF